MVSALVDVVIADLSHLAGELHQQVDDHSLRRGSAILRRLLVDNDLQKAWKAAGRPRQPLILATTLEPILAAMPQGKIALAAAGGALYQGMALMGLLEVGYVLEPDVARAFPDSNSVNRALRLLQEVAAKSSGRSRKSAGGRRKATG